MIYTATQFTPYSALLGGILIGLSALMLLAFNGRIAGISGIVGNLFSARGSDFQWRLAFTLGLIAGAFAYLNLAPAGAIEIHIETGWAWMLTSGFIVGVGTRLGRGCTSGHGVCGIGRVSPRSIVATITFMIVAGLTVFVIRHVFGA